jgi:DNA polymerase-4
VLHLDVDAFFAALEQRDNPSLRGRPVAVGTGVVASCSYESRPFGVRTGMRLLDARRLCPRLVVLPGDYRKYEIASRRILGICLEEAPLVEAVALDDLYLEGGEGDPRHLAGQILEEVGLRVSVGVGSNKLTACVATQEVKDRKARGIPGDVAEVPPGQEREYLAPWPAEILPGVGPRAQAQLARLNVRLVREVAEMPASVLTGLFGPRGLAFRDAARGIDPRPVRPGRPALSVSRCTSFDPPVGDWAILSAMLAHLIERAFLAVRHQRLTPGGVTVRVRYADHRWEDSRAPLRGGGEAEGKTLARERLGRLCGRRLPLRLLGVELSPLRAASAQGELFPSEAEARRERLRECRDEVRSRFGFLSLVSGEALPLLGRLDHDRDNFHLRTPCLTR